MQKTAKLPTIQAESEFKKKVFEACESMNLDYSQVVTRLLEKWLAGDVLLDQELDQQFIEAAEAAIHSPRGQKALQSFAQHYDPNREYPDAIKL